GSKLAILGPPRIVAEVPENLAPACGLFSASGYVQEARLTDYVLPFDSRGSAALAQGGAASPAPAGPVIPVPLGELLRNGLVGQVDRQVCWERSVETLMARKDEIAGLAVASDERIEAYLLYVKREMDPPPFAPTRERELRRDLAGALAEAGEAEIVSLRS